MAIGTVAQPIITTPAIHEVGMRVNPQGGTALSPATGILSNMVAPNASVSAIPGATTSVNVAQSSSPAIPTAQQYTPSQVSINAPTDTVQGQIQGIINADSPLMQQAETRARQNMARGGLLNSSMAVGAAQGAVLDAAMPIASQDANTYAKTSLANVDMANQAASFNAQQSNNMNMEGARLTSDVDKFNTTAKNTAIINQLDAGNKIQLANIQATYQKDMQSSQASSTMFNSTMDWLYKIQQDQNMDATTKQKHADQAIQMLQSGLALQGSIANLDLANVLDFSGGNVSVKSAPGTTPTTGNTPVPKNTPAPTTYIAGQSNDPIWEKALAEFNASHTAKYGAPLNRPWSADAGTQSAYQTVVNRYNQLKASAK